MQLHRILAAGLALSSTAAFAAAPDKVDNYLRSEMARMHIPAAAVAIVRDGKIVKTAVYGTADVELGAAAKLHSPFQIASTTKLLTSVLLMQLVGEGKIALDAPVSHYIDGTPEAWATMTVRHLASHTSGLPRVPFPPDVADPAAAVEYAKKQTLAAKPGETAAYGSVDFSILTYILEKVTGETLERLLAQRIAKPLGMTETRFSRSQLSPGRDVVKNELVPGRVTTYQWSDGRQMGYRYLYPAYTFSAGGAFVSIHDAANFLQGVASGRLVNAQLTEEMFKPVKLADGKSAGFSVGWTQASYRGQREVGHAGGPALADLRYYPEQKLGVIVLTNQRTLMPTLARGVAAQFLPAGKFLVEPGINDAAPDRTVALKRALDQLKAGNPDPASFSGPALEGLKAYAPLLALDLGGLPPMSRLVLLETSPDNGDRIYRAVYGKDHSVRWVVRFDQNGLIADIDPVDE